MLCTPSFIYSSCLAGACVYGSSFSFRLTNADVYLYKLYFAIFTINQLFVGGGWMEW